MSKCLKCVNDYLFRIILDTKYINFTSLLIICNIIFSALAYTLWYRLTLKSYKYSYLYAQFYVNVLFTLFMVMSFVGYIYKRRYSNEPYKTRFLNKQVLSIYFKFAVLETIIGYLAILPVFYFSPVFLILFGQLSLIMNHIGAYFYFDRRYTNSQIYSVLIVLFAVIITTITESHKPINSSTMNQIQHNISNICNNGNSVSGVRFFNIANDTEVFDNEYLNKSANVNLTDQNQSESTISLNIYYYILLTVMLILLRVVATFSSLYKEKKYKELSLDAVETITIVSIIEIPMSIFVFVFLLIPLPAPAIHIPVQQFGEYIINGTQLLFVNEDKEILIVMSLFLILSAISSIMEFVITQKLNSTVNVIVGVSTLSFSVIFINIQWIAGDAYRSINFYEYISLILIISALIHYRIETPEEDKQIIDKNAQEIYGSNMSLFSGNINVPINTIIKRDFYSVSRRNDESNSDDDDSNDTINIEVPIFPNNIEPENNHSSQTPISEKNEINHDQENSDHRNGGESSIITKNPTSNNQTNPQNIIYLDDINN